MIKLPSIHENCFDRFYFRLNFSVLSLTRVHYHSFQWLLSELGFKQTNLHKGKMGEWEILFYAMNHCKTNNNSTSNNSFLKYFKENETGNLVIWIKHLGCGGPIPADRLLLCKWSSPKRNSLRGHSSFLGHMRHWVHTVSVFQPREPHSFFTINSRR